MNMLAQTPIIEIVGGQKKFGGFTALHDINLSILPGEIVTLLGPSGCGKTTLMRLIAGFEDLTGGSISIAGTDVATLPPERRPVNMVFQRYALFPHLDVFQNIEFGLKVKGMGTAERKERVQRMLHIVQLEAFAHRYIDELSGGQCQRVALGRALVNEPKVLLLDEPLAALDLKIRQHMLAEMKRIHAETKATFVYVTHDQDEAMILSDRVVLMEKGRIIQIDGPEEMYARPRSLFAAKFLGEINLLQGSLTHREAGGYRIATPEGTFDLPAESAGEGLGTEAILTIRPEMLSFAESIERQSVFGVVEDVVFTGSRSFYSVRLDGGTLVRVQVQRSGRAALPHVGERTPVSWHADDAVLVPVA
jgi:ABC-type Fe3+/spermidine/putrescine transport system ATPase subunit